MEWQPIETAPKDGTHVLLFCECADIPITGGYWTDAHNCWVAGGYLRRGNTMPSHWMPLPEAPEQLG